MLLTFLAGPINLRKFIATRPDNPTFKFTTLPDPTRSWKITTRQGLHTRGEPYISFTCYWALIRFIVGLIEGFNNEGLLKVYWRSHTRGEPYISFTCYWALIRFIKGLIEGLLKALLKVSWRSIKGLLKGPHKREASPIYHLLATEL